MQQVPGYQSAAVSLKRAVKSFQQIPYIHLCQSARQPFGVYTGGNTIYLMLRCPHVRSPPPHAGDPLFNFHFIFQTGRQSRQANRLHLAVNHHLNAAKRNLGRVNKRPCARRRSAYLFLFILECVQSISVVLPS